MVVDLDETISTKNFGKYGRLITCINLFEIEIFLDKPVKSYLPIEIVDNKNFEGTIIG